MEEIMEPEEAKEGFICDSDAKAEWIIKTVRKEQKNRDRLLELAEAEKKELDERIADIKKDYESNTSFLMMQLQNYMQTGADKELMKETKTQVSYELLSGKCIWKKPTVDYERDTEALVGWLGDNKHPEYVKVKLDVDWANLKKHIRPLASGFVVNEEGEVLEGIKAVEKEGSFDIKFKE